ncbi:2-amino-4-hydroxy-6-hydroxymethyldihydropteridine diphosphokinase [Erythrobacter sp. GH3-10]|uniref:2-amino-4-hydroxy-6-hydroxymethyldihydropteridine pyrophosphokinase n=2 Tax=Aurantiacibacter rhizosphaerae TaxID=2691582 RepID=A0A844XHA8_9SPHN|nr:2-amino-4-hydroxy-6-hydroxymethyldihydropteridine diphosphokinase [Aurantiacibacter rhizosphaerae]
MAGVGGPRAVLHHAIALMEKAGFVIDAVAPIIASRPVGPSQRTYANGALVATTDLVPEQALAALQKIERDCGRQRRGQRWRARPLDLDIVLWSGGVFDAPELKIPHTLFRERDFVLGPAAAIAPDWRDPLTGRTLKQLHARLTRNRPAPR